MHLRLCDELPVEREWQAKQEEPITHPFDLQYLLSNMPAHALKAPPRTPVALGNGIDVSAGDVIEQVPHGRPLR